MFYFNFKLTELGGELADSFENESSNNKYFFYIDPQDNNNFYINEQNQNISKDGSSKSKIKEDFIIKDNCISDNENSIFGLKDINISNQKIQEEDKLNKETNYKTNKIIIFNCSKKPRKLGRKRKYIYGGKHNKFSNDNMTRKLKSKLFDAILKILNKSFASSIFETSKNNLNKINNIKPFFLKIKQEIIKNINVNNNLTLLNSKLKDIFSNEVSKKVTSFGINYNKSLINIIYKENKHKKVISILERTFLECLEQFRGTKNFNELKGLEEDYKNVINDLIEKGEKNEYISKFKNFVNDFEEIYKKKKAKKGIYLNY